ncbi:LysR family transcriptional regulator [Acidisphaera sp. L21]|uniref:LysR family transcriptional regulator n=1 Tax=Acidisphaera sp. L21 TaxID=1641851 RepID=UPI00131CA3B4|nr:LysR family transcriptional regulator [Acidisphaera sp. L21]
MNINLNLLQTFIEVAEHASFRRAAETIGRTQSAVSMQIQQLEAQLGLQLFTRTTRQVRLTLEGEQLLSHVRAGMTELMAGLRQANGLAASHRGRVAIACAPSVAGSRLPGVMAEFQAAYPGVSARLRELPLTGIVESVRMQDVDFGIGPTPTALNGLSFRPVMTDPICAVFRTGTIKARDGVSLAALSSQPIILMGGLRPMIEPAAQQAGVVLAVRYEAQQILTVMGLVGAGLGVAIVPGIAVPSPLGHGITTLPITSPMLTREVGIITQYGRPLSPIAAELTRLLEARLLEPILHQA